MKIKSLLALFAALSCVMLTAQTKSFSYTDVESRNELRQWEKYPGSSLRTVKFTPEKIDLNLDKAYHLKIVRTTHLPDHGAIYLCKDEKQKDVTVTLVSNDRMFLYNDAKRFLIHFKPSPKTNVSRAYADVD